MGKWLRQWRTGAILIGMLAILPSQPVFAVSHDSSPMKWILVLGDSLSAGFGLKPSQAYPALLTEKLRAAKLDFEITNASQTGGTTEGGLPRLPAHPKRKLNLFSFELGVNDASIGVPLA